MNSAVRFCTAVPCAVCVAGVLLVSGQALAVVSSNGGANPPFTGIHINSFLGADTFYNAGYSGGNAVVASIEAGHMWSGHETLGHVSVFLNDNQPGTQLGQTDRHATWVGHALAGRSDPMDPPGGEAENVRRGIAHSATLWSGAIATQWNGAPYTLSFNLNTNSLRTPYLQSMVNGVQGRTADVINSSWGSTAGQTAFNSVGVFIDAIAFDTSKLVVFSAGNRGNLGANTVGTPGSSFNVMTVGALGSDTDAMPYNQPSAFSSFGPNDYFNPNTGMVIPGVRSVVDIAAPGQDLTLAFYGGATGGNTGGPVSGGPSTYTQDVDGTSFAAPLVSGGAALLVDYAYTNYAGNANARDARVLKSVLMNSAHKTQGWDNGQFNNAGVITTTQSLDYKVGAGRMDLHRAYAQYTAGTNDVPGLGGGTVNPIGWDYGEVTPAAPNEYFIDTPLLGGSTFTATLNWFIHATYQPTSTLQAFIDLDLEVWEVIGGVPVSLVAESVSLYNNAEHLHFEVPNDGDYMVRVLWAGVRYNFAGVDSERFGLAWSGTVIPGPGAIGLLTVAGLLAARRRRG